MLARSVFIMGVQRGQNNSAGSHRGNETTKGPVFSGLGHEGPRPSSIRDVVMLRARRMRDDASARKSLETEAAIDT
jgi:hypothetical protein